MDPDPEPSSYGSGSGKSSGSLRIRIHNTAENEPLGVVIVLMCSGIPAPGYSYVIRDGGGGGWGPK
jgi:hypothetical protein